MIAIEKIKELIQIAALSNTPMKLLLDRFRLYPHDFIAMNKHSLKLKLKPGCGEWFTFLENVCRQDYIQHGIAIKPGDCVVDLGANIGAFTVLAASIVGDKGLVHAYEPNPETYERLVENIKLNNLSNVVTFNEAAGETDGFVELFCCEKSAHCTIFDKIDGRFNSQVEVSKVRMSSIQTVMDRLPGAIDLMKIDVEGAEHGIVRSFDETTAGRIKQLAFEIHDVEGEEPSRLKSKLVELGYTVVDKYPFVALSTR